MLRKKDFYLFINFLMFLKTKIFLNCNFYKITFSTLLVKIINSYINHILKKNQTFCQV